MSIEDSGPAGLHFDFEHDGPALPISNQFRSNLLDSREPDAYWWASAPAKDRQIDRLKVGRVIAILNAIHFFDENDAM